MLLSLEKWMSQHPFFKLSISALLGCCMGISWNHKEWAPIFIISFSLIITFVDITKSKGDKIFFCLIAILFWQLISLEWLLSPNGIAYISITLIDTLILSIPFLFLAIINSNYKYLFFIVTILFCEFLLEKWSLSFPYFNFGYIFSSYPKFIQWYKFTTIHGGSFIFVSISIITSFLIIQILQNQIKRIIFVSTSLISLISALFIYSNSIIKSIDETDRNQIILINTRIKSEVKYNTPSDDILTHYLNEITKKKSGNPGQLFALPESAIPHETNIHELNSHVFWNRIKRFCVKNKISVITGAFLFEFTHDKNKKVYTSCVMINEKGEISYRSKEKLVPIEEYDTWNLRKYFKSLGGFSFDTPPNTNPTTFYHNNKEFGYIICYEILYASLVEKMAKNGANFIIAGFNESWINNANFSKQMLDISVIRAIENQIPVLKVSNCGLNTYIDSRGNYSEIF